MFSPVAFVLYRTRLASDANFSHRPLQPSPATEGEPVTPRAALGALSAFVESQRSA
jgi:hypothetical protein